MVQDDDSFYISSDISTLKGLGPNYVNSFYNKNIFSLFDLLLDFPFKYQDKTKITSIGNIDYNSGYVLIDAVIADLKNITSSRVRLLKVLLQDNTGKIEADFFNLYPNQIRNYSIGQRVLAFGMVKVNDYNGRLNLQQPSVTFLDKTDAVEVSDRLTPIYHAVEKVPQATIRKVIDATIRKLKSVTLKEILPAELNPFKITLSQAIDLCHNPYPCTDIQKAFILEHSEQFKRICLEELVAYQLTLLFIKKKNENLTARAIEKDDSQVNKFRSQLPFELTGAQIKAIDEIGNDLSKQTPMIRLLHGDVGTGKTIVAVISCLRVCKEGQSVVLAPTELLCQQHYKVFDRMLSPLGIKVVMLTSSLKGNKRKQTLLEIKNGEAQVIVGTHSVFQQDVEYKSLYLAIIDEQHRFGIEQRVALLQKAPKGLTVHQLVMTATPIPRTLQLALFSDLDVSILNELPKNRKPITTAVMSDESKPKIIDRLREVCSEGTQVYWVCPNIEENEEENASAIAAYKELKIKLPNLNIGLIHGQQKLQDRNKVMKDFIDNKINILVATTIIEVGVDVPNASIIIIEGADRLGLAQLHQLRGRVGRGSKESYCILVYKKTETANEVAMQRLGIMRSTNDGFKIATEDLKLRGPGEVLGNKQAGFDLFRVVDVNRDFQLVEVARKIALTLIQNNLDVCKLLIRRWFPKYKVN